MLNIVCFKWNTQEGQRYTIPSQRVTGKIKSPYTSDDVNALYRQLKRNSTVPFKMICVTDDPKGVAPAIHTVPIWHVGLDDLGGCYNRLFVFSEEARSYLGDRFLCIDLDTIIVGNVDHILVRTEPFVYYKWVGLEGEPDRFNCGLFMMDAGVRSWVWEMFYAQPLISIQKAAVRFVGTDQAWCNYIMNLEDEASFGEADGILDFRVHFLKRKIMDVPRPDGACMVTFAGPRNPKDYINSGSFPWIKKALES